MLKAQLEAFCDMGDDGVETAIQRGQLTKAPKEEVELDILDSLESEIAAVAEAEKSLSELTKASLSIIQQ